MSNLFDSNFVYPHDGVGCYQDFEGKIVFVDCERVDVEIKDYGIVTVYMRVGSAITTVPLVGYGAKIRIYDSGGGFYPDNEIISWYKLLV